MDKNTDKPPVIPIPDDSIVILCGDGERQALGDKLMEGAKKAQIKRTTFSFDSEMNYEMHQYDALKCYDDYESVLFTKDPDNQELEKAKKLLHQIKAAVFKLMNGLIQTHDNSLVVMEAKSDTQVFELVDDLGALFDNRPLVLINIAKEQVKARSGLRDYYSTLNEYVVFGDPNAVEFDFGAKTA